MHFSNFAIWLLDRRTGKLELLINYQLPPEAVEVELFASTEGNGIVGYVAATGRSYICPDVQQDPRYLPGLQRAASSLTVPMTLDNQVIGVLDVESVKQDAFTDDDRQFAEIFGRYVAIALNTFDLLVTEQVTTTGKLASNVQSEIAAPLNDIITDAATLMEDYIGHDDLRHRLQAICDNVMLVKKAVQSVAEHKAGILGRRGTSQVDPVLNGRRVLVADDEDAILETISEVLANYGCDVETARDGADAVSMIASRTYDAVLSDIKMPNRSGYEVFAAAKDRRPDCAVILMTGFGYDPNHSIIRARREGLSAVLFKPFKVDQLISELRSALQAQVTS
jgi:CheY-like chemotaxis protein